MLPTLAPDLTWSRESTLAAQAITANAPRAPGVYLILQSPDYPRYRGTSRILKIGMSRGNLQTELLNHLGRLAVANRLARVMIRKGITVTFATVLTDSAQASDLEARLLREYEDTHWDLPLLNAQRGYLRSGDAHYRTPLNP